MYRPSPPPLRISIWLRSVQVSPIKLLKSCFSTDCFLDVLRNAQPLEDSPKIKTKKQLVYHSQVSWYSCFRSSKNTKFFDKVTYIGKNLDCSEVLCKKVAKALISGKGEKSGKRENRPKKLGRREKNELKVGR